jgi:hypothetical protein
MTAQTTTTVDEAFWDLVLSDPDLVDAALESLADPAEPTGPGGSPPPEGDAGGRDRPRPGPPNPPAPPTCPGQGRRAASGRVRAPPPPTRPEGVGGEHR